MYRRCGKRLIDILVAASALILLSPLLLFISIVLLASGSKPIFIQARPGFRGRVFRMYKFRTMRTFSSARTEEERITAIGRLLRRTSLDELPQLWHVLTGKMSLIGPRPLLTEYLSLYTERQHRRHDVRPGITGWAQINGRNAISWEEKFEYDVWYVEHYSFAVDMRILVKTFASVIGSQNPSAAIRIPEKFPGNL